MVIDGLLQIFAKSSIERTMHAFRPLLSHNFVQDASSLRFIGKIIFVFLWMFTLVAAQVISKSEGREQMGGFRLLWGNSATGFFLHTVGDC